RVSGGSVILNGSQILSSADLGSGASGWSRVVQPLSEDTIVVAVQGTAGAYVTASLLSTPDASFLVFGPERFIRPVGTPVTATPGSFIDLCFNATDVTPPVITISQPANKFITREAQVGVAGSVQDETATTVRVNGQPASMSGTSFTATVPLAAEGNNVIHIVATDAAGHSTDSS